MQLAKEIYRLDINMFVNGDSETKKKLTATEKMVEQTEKKLKALDKIRASPSTKLKDSASSTIDKVKAKTEKLNNTTATVKLKAKDEATKTINKAQNRVNKFIKAGAKKIISIGLAGTVALGGIGLGTSINTFANFEKGLSNVKAVTSATNAEMTKLKDTAKNLGSSTAWSAVQVTQAEELLGQAGFSVKETISALPGLLSLASAGDLDLAEATDIASGTLKAFNIDASKTSHVADVLALSASTTNSNVTDLGETMKYVAPISSSLGISLEDTAAAAGLLSNQNIKGSQAGTVLRQTMARLASPTKEASELMKKYGINAFDVHGNMKPLSGVVDNLNKSLDKLNNQQRADVISTIFGTESMSGVLALMNQGGKSLSSLSESLKDTKNAADKMAETKLDNLAGQWTILKSAVEGAQIELGEKLAPYAKQFVTWLTGKMPEITDKIVKTVDYISKHTDELKAFIGTITGVAVAFTGLNAASKISNTISGIKGLAGILKGAKAAEETSAIAGGLKSISKFGKLLPAIMTPAGLAITGALVAGGVAIVANNNLLKKSLLTTTDELGPIEKIMNKFNGSIYKSKSEMEKLGLVYEDFSGNISDDFKRKVQESTKSLHEFEFYLGKINFDNVIDKNESVEFDRKIESMFQSAISTVNENKEKYQASMKEMFMDDGIFSEAEQSTLEYLTKNYDDQISAEEKLRDDIYKIKKDAIEKHGKLLDEDIKQIKDKLLEMSQIELEAAGGTEDEMLYVKNKLKARLEKADLKDSSSILQDARKDIDSRVIEVKAKYDTNLDKLKADLANPNYAGDKEKLKSTIEENEKNRADKLNKLNGEWETYLSEAYKSNPELKGRINKYDGTILNGKDLKTQDNLEKIKEKYADLKKVTEDGFYGIKDPVSNTMNAVYVTVDKTTGEITGVWNYTSKEVGGYTDDIKKKVKDLGESHLETSGKAIASLAHMQASVETSTNKIKTIFGQVVGELDNVSVAADGTRTGIINLNGTPIEITSNAQGQITSMTELGKSIKEKVPESKTIVITTIFKKIFQTVKDFFSNNNKVQQNANGTNFSKEGLSTVDERGWELASGKAIPIIGSHNRNPLTYMSKGSKILNHMQSVQDMKEEVARQVNSKISNFPNKINYQIIKPQQNSQVAGAGGLSVGDINVNINGNQDIDSLIEEATQAFGRKLKQALKNIK